MTEQPTFDIPAQDRRDAADELELHLQAVKLTYPGSEEFWRGYQYAIALLRSPG
jgi:hypothetical protein